MRNLLLTALFAVVAVLGYSQTPSYKVEGNTYKSVSTPKTKQEPIATGYEWQDSKGNTYPILMSPSTGSCFVEKISSKTGKPYRQYLGEEISKDICSRLGREYKSTKK